MTTPPSSAVYRQNRLGLRFLIADIEKRYRAWRNEQNIPAIRLTVAVSIPPWLIAPLLGRFWRPDIDWFAYLWPGYAFVIPMFVVTGIATYTAMRPYATVLRACSLTVAGCCALWIAAVKVQTIPNVETTGATIGLTTLLICFATFMRLPPKLAVLSTTPFTVATMAVIVHRTQVGTLAPIYAFAYVTIPAITYIQAAVMSVVNERFFRGAFVNEQLLVEQRASLEHSRDLIRRYVPPALVAQIIEGRLDAHAAPQRHRLTVLFSDIVGFTDMADRVEPELMTQIISEYMSTMSQVVDDHQGTVNEFVGDGLMTIFGAPLALEPELQARRAVEAARAMQARLPELNTRWRQLGLSSALQIRIGINTGMMSVGSYGSEGRMTYTAIGLQTNIAARIQSHCEPGGILISEATWQLVHEVFAFAPKGEVQFKGVHFPIALYAPLATAAGLASDGQASG